MHHCPLGTGLLVRACIPLEIILRIARDIGEEKKTGYKDEASRMNRMEKGKKIRKQDVRMKAAG